MPAWKTALVAVALLALVGCSRGGGPAGSGGAGGGRPATPVSETDAQRLTTSLIKTAPGPVGLTVDAQGRVWVSNADDGSVSRLDAAGQHVDLTKPVGNAPLRLAPDKSGVWVTVFSDQTLERLDATSGVITRKVRLGPEPEGITSAYGAIWVVMQASSELVRVDPKTGDATSRVSVGAAPRLVTSGLGSLWVSDFGSGRLYRIDPKTGDVAKSRSLCFGPQGMLVQHDVVWVACTTDNVLVGVDPDTLRTTAKLAMPGSPDALAEGPHGLVLVALQKGPTLAVVDPTDHSVVRRDALGTQDQLYDRANIDVVFSNGRAYVSSYLEGGVYRVKP